MMERELARLDRLLHRQALRLRGNYQLTLDELRGLYITDDQVDALVATAEPDAPSLDALLAEADALDEAIAADGSPLRELAERFGLSAFERDTLLLAAAPEIDLKYETVVAYLNNDITRKWPTVDLALRALCRHAAHRATEREHIEAGARLFALGLIEPLDGDRPVSSLAQSFRASPVAIRRLAGLSDQAPSPAVERSAGDETLDAELAERVERLAHYIATRPTRPLVVLEGEYGSGRRAAASRLCAAVGRRLVELDVAKLESGQLQRVGLHAVLHGAGVYLRGWTAAAAEALAAQGAWPICLETNAGDDWRTPLRGCELVHTAMALPDVARRRALWAAALAHEGMNVNGAAAGEVAERFSVSPGVIRDAARAAAVACALSDDGVDLMAATKAQLDQRLGKLAVKVACGHSWNDLVLPQQTLARVEDIVGAIRHRHRVYEEWGFARHVGHRRGLAAMFAGASGTGKTMTAGVIANDVGLDLYRIELSGIVSKYIGETEKNLDLIFAAASSAEAILFFDEADALFGKRSEVKDAHDRYANVEVAYLLQKLEAHTGVVILASNLAKNIDPAFARRLHYIVEFPKPTQEQRCDLWHKTLGPDAPLAADVDLPFLARKFDCPGGDIRCVALDAAFSAATENRPIAMADLVDAMARQLRKDGRLPSPALSQRMKGRP